MPRSVIDTVFDHLEFEGRIGGNEAAEAAHDRIAGAADVRPNVSYPFDKPLPAPSSR
jgi:hypothetical protein